MTAYAATGNVSLNSNGAASWLTVKPGAYELKIGRIEVNVLTTFLQAGTSGVLYAALEIHRFAGGTTSGGSVVTAVPLRQGGPAATSTTRMGGSITGTDAYIAKTTAVGPVGSGNYEFPFDVTVAPGSALGIRMTGNSGDQFNITIMAVVYFEELRLSWHY